MNREVFITCAVTGSGDTTGKSDLVPVTPKQIADDAIAAAKAGAAIAAIAIASSAICFGYCCCQGWCRHCALPCS